MLKRFPTFLAATFILAAACSFDEPNRGGGSGGAGASGTSGGTTSLSGGTSTAGGKTNTSGGTSGGTLVTEGGSSAEGGAPNAGAGGEAGEVAVTGGAGGAEAGSTGLAGAGGVVEGGAGGAEFMGGAGGAGGEPPLVEIGSSIYPMPAGPDNVPKPAGAVGGLAVLNWAGFKAAVSYSFDDTNLSQIQAYPELQALGVRYTFYLQTAKGGIDDPVWTQAAAAGHELGNHTEHHYNQAELSTLTNPDAELDLATQKIESKHKTRVWTMAAPYGDSVYESMAQSRFFINRNVGDGIMLPNDKRNPFGISAHIPPATATTMSMNAELEKSRGDGAWRVLCMHGFTGVNDYAYQPIPLQVFKEHVTYMKSLGDVWIDTVANVGAYWLGQRAFTAATKTVAGTSTTWTWTLPAHFPPNNYLRVRVTGGTLKQQNQPLEWNPHGFYEVALDARSLTLEN